MENSRDDLLYEIHKLPNQSNHDKMLLKAYFEEVETLSNLLDKQIRLILGRTLNTVRKEPTVIVTALRLIEREEKRDQQAIQVIDLACCKNAPVCLGMLRYNNSLVVYKLINKLPSSF